MSATAEVRPEAPWEDLRYAPDGLVPVVVQARASGEVLMLAYANREAVRRTVQERRAWFWSRSRGELWRKGDTSGHVLDVAEVRWDCDADALLYVAVPHGPACHTGQDTCFFRGEGRMEAAAAPPPDPPGSAVSGLGAVMERLARVIDERRRTMPQGSYVAGLLAAGPARALQKVGEEAVEAVIGGMRVQSDRDAAVAEFADLLFHTLVAMAACEVPSEDVAAELSRRHALRPSR